LLRLSLREKQPQNQCVAPMRKMRAWFIMVALFRSNQREQELTSTSNPESRPTDENKM
jgi:hypothetical protein